VSLETALRRYREDAFTDDDVTRCTGLSVRAWRQLLKLDAVRTVNKDRGRGHIRLCDTTTFKRAAVIAALNRAGFSLALSGRIAYFLPLDELLFTVWDPYRILLQVGSQVDPDTGLPPREEQPKVDWFDPNKPAQADPEHDLLIEIYDGRFVGIVCGIEQGERAIYGDLRNDGTRFVCWFPFHRNTITEVQPPYEIHKVFPKWHDPFRPSDRLDPHFLDYRFEDHGGDDDPLAMAAAAAARSPLFKTSVNITLAVRTALRRYLGIEPVLSDSETGNAYDG
jgi:hypothetical protein